MSGRGQTHTYPAAYNTASKRGRRTVARVKCVQQNGHWSCTLSGLSPACGGDGAMGHVPPC